MISALVTLAMRGQRTDAGTVLIMIGAGLSGGGFVAACAGFSPYNKNDGGPRSDRTGYSAQFKRWARWGVACLVVGVPLFVVGLSVHHR